jgi:plastocyanin
MVTSTIAPVAAAGSPTTNRDSGEPRSSFDLDSPGVEASLGEGTTGEAPVPQTAEPAFSNPDLAGLDVRLGTPTSNNDGELKIPVQIEGEYKKGQYPWRIPINVTAESGDVRQSTVLNIAPGAGESDYLAKTQFTMQFVQEKETTHEITATARPQFEDANRNDALETVAKRDVTVSGASEQSSISNAGRIRNNDVSEPPRAVTRVGRYKASETGGAYLEDSSLPTGRESTVSNFTFARSINGQHATFSSKQGDMDIGTLNPSLPNGSAQTLVVGYKALEDDPITVTPVNSDGLKIDTEYTLPANPRTDDRCHPSEGTDVCVFRLTDTESDRIGQQTELVLSYEADETTSMALFCQDVITGGMPDDGAVCGLGDIATFAEGGITQVKATPKDDSNKNIASGEETLSIDAGERAEINVTVTNNGNIPVEKTVRMTSSDPESHPAQTRTPRIPPGESETVGFTTETISSQSVQYQLAFDGSTETVEVTPSGLADSSSPAALPGGPYIVPLGEAGETRTKVGLQTQTLTKKPGPDWEKTTEEPVGSAGGTDEFTTYASDVPVVGTVRELESRNGNVEYLNEVLGETQGTSASVAYGEQISNTKRQLPEYLSERRYSLDAVEYTRFIETQREISPERPAGVGWTKVDKYGTVPTGVFETEQFRPVESEGDESAQQAFLDTHGEGWVLQQDIPFETKVVGYEYQNGTSEPAGTGWEKSQYLGTETVTLENEYETRILDEQRDLGGNWTPAGDFAENQDTYKYKRPITEEQGIYAYKRPLTAEFGTYERPVTETTYKWERDIYDAKFTYQKKTNSESLYEWEGPRYEYVTNYESETVTLDGSLSFDRGQVGVRGIDGYEWTFEDGTVFERSKQHETVTKEYGGPLGTYRPTLTVYDEAGNRASNTTEVRVIRELAGTDEATPTEPFNAVPELSAQSQRDRIVGEQEAIPYNVDLAGNINGDMWTVTIEAQNNNYKEEIWSGFDIVNGEEQIYGTIDPTAAGLGGGDATFTVTATPANANSPAVTDTFTVYVCKGEQYTDNGACEELDTPDTGGPPNSVTCEEDPTQDKCPCEVNPTKECPPGEVFIRTNTATWGESSVGDDPLGNGNGRIETVGPGGGSTEELSNVWAETEDIDSSQHVRRSQGLEQIAIGYTRRPAAQDEGLVGFYGLEDKTGNLPEKPKEQWTVTDESYSKNTGYVYYDRAYGATRGIERGPGENAESAPDFDEAGVFGSKGVTYTTDDAGFIQFISPETATEKKSGMGLSNQLKGDMTVSFWAKSFQDRSSPRDPSREVFYSMQDANNVKDFTAHEMSLLWDACESPGQQDGDVCGDSALSTLQRLQPNTRNARASARERGVTEPVKRPVERHDVSDDTVMGGITSGEWNHYVYTVDEDGTDSRTTLSVNGEEVYSREVPGATVNRGLGPDAKVSRFIWGGTVTKHGYRSQANGMSFDNIRIYDKAIRSPNREYIDNEGTLTTTGKWLNETDESYELDEAPTVTLNGNIASTSYPKREGTSGTVTVEVIPWTPTQDGELTPDVSKAGTATFDGTGAPGASLTYQQDVTGMEVDQVGKVSTRITMESNRPGYSPTVESVSVGVGERVEIPDDNEPPAVKSPETNIRGDTAPHSLESLEVNILADDEQRIDSWGLTHDRPKFRTQTKSGPVTDGFYLNREPETYGYGSEFGVQCAGEHTITASATDRFGATGTASTSFTVPNNKPSAAISTNVTPVIDPGETIEFDAGGSLDPDGDALNYRWQFSDSERLTFADSVTHTFEQPGTYQVTLEVEDSRCGVDTETLEVAVQNTAPIANAGSDTEVLRGDSVTLDGRRSTDAEGHSLTYKWDFDSDGQYDAARTGTPRVTHTYETPGEKIATLQVSDGFGGTDTDTVRVNVIDSAPLLINEHDEDSDDYLEVVALRDGVNPDNYKIFVDEAGFSEVTWHLSNSNIGTLNRGDVYGEEEGNNYGNNPTNAGRDWKVELIDKRTGEVVDCVVKGTTFRSDCGFYVPRGSDNSYYRTDYEDTDTAGDWGNGRTSENSRNPGQGQID